MECSQNHMSDGICTVSLRMIGSGNNKPIHTAYRGIGLGDQIILLGAAVYFARKLGSIAILTSPMDRKSISDLLVNHPEVEVVCYGDENKETIKLVDTHGESIIRELDGPPMDWYDKMGLPFSERWDSSPVPDAVSSIDSSDIATIFVHDDVSRGYRIPVEGYRPLITESIADHVPALKGAREIHCMDSSFFNLIESMEPLKAELFYYPGVKGHHPYTILRHAWNIVSGN